MNTIAVELGRNAVQIVDPLGKILFDNLILQKGDIEYDSTTGEIKINKIGRYSINWSIATQASVGSQDITFSIKTSTGEDIATSSPNKVGQLTGFGIVQVDIAPVSLALVSKQENFVQLSMITKVKAHLMLGELLESNVGEEGKQGPSGPPGPPGTWESSGLQLLSISPVAGEEITILQGEVIPFNHKILEFNGINYSENTINIFETGYYLVAWEFIAKPEQQGDMIICLENTSNMPYVYGKSGSKSQDYSTISGKALVMVSNIMLPYSFDLQLINRSGIPIKVTSASDETGGSHMSFASSLTVVKIGDMYWS